MATSLDRVRELRWLSGTTYNTAFTAADSTYWAAGTANKLKIIGFDAGDLDQEGEEDTQLESQAAAGQPDIPTVKIGPLKFTTWFEGAESDTNINPVANLMGAAMGGVTAPTTNRTDTVDDTGTNEPDKIYASGIDGFVEPGQAVLCGVVGDARGGGEARQIAAEGTHYVDLSMALADTPTSGDSLIYSTTCFFDPTADQTYLDFLALGQATQDQLQAIGCAGTFTLEGLAPNEAPKVNWEWQTGDWQDVPSGERDQLEPGTASDGNDPATLRGLGVFRIGDNGSTTIGTAFKINQLSISPGFTYEAVDDRNGINGRGGWQLVVGQPTLECVVLLEGAEDPLPDFGTDWANKTAKQVYCQWGKASPAVAIHFPKAYFIGRPKRVKAGNFAAVKIQMKAVTAGVTAATTAQYRLKSAMAIHFF